jgi:hypothetical protein
MALSKRKRSGQRRYKRPTGRGPREGERKRRPSIIHYTHGKEHSMKYGHVTGEKKERKGATDWYKHIEEENIRKIEAEWQARQQAK